MFAPLGLFRKIVCPEGHACGRDPCLFSHDFNAPADDENSLIGLLASEPPTRAARSAHQPDGPGGPGATSNSSVLGPPKPALTVSKRPFSQLSPLSSSSSDVREGPRKVRKTDSTQQQAAATSSRHKEINSVSTFDLY